MSWEQVKLKRVTSTVAGGTPAVDDPIYWTDGDDGLPWVSIGDMSSKDRVATTSRRVTTAGVVAARLPVGGPGTLLMSMYASLGHTAVLESKASWNQALLGIFPTQAVDSRYLKYALVSIKSRLGEFARSNTQANLNAEQVGNLEIPLPPVEEQRRIADFLDTETARIDHLRAIREKQFEVLEEKSVCRVYDVVRGTHVAGDRIPSGLDWLGSIPEHWRVAAVSHYFEVELGKMLNQERARGEHLRPYLRVANVQWGKVEIGELAMMNFPPGERERYRVREGDLLVNEGGSWPGRAAIWNGDIEEIYYQKALHRIRARGSELTSWLYFCLVVAERMRVFQVQGNSSTMTHLTREQLRPQRFPFPTVDEQEHAVKYLQEWERQDERVRDALIRQLSTLAERRQALITAAVTGEIDVSTKSGRGIEG